MAQSVLDAARIAREIHSSGVSLRTPPSSALGWASDSPYAIYIKPIAPLAVRALGQRYPGDEPFRLEEVNTVVDTAMWGASYIWADDRLAIFSRCGPTICWERFVAAKELMHIYTGASHNGGWPSLLQAAKSHRGVIGDDIHRELDGELFCFVLAIEVMLPYEMRRVLWELHNNGESNYNIALATKMPQYIIDEFFTPQPRTEPNPGYCATSKKAHELIQSDPGSLPPLCLPIRKEG